MTAMNVSDTLNLAADLIEERGWGHGVDSMAGVNGLCLMGAIYAATFGRFDHDYAGAASCAAGQAVYNYLDLDTADQDAGWEWNDGMWSYDQPTRTWSPKRVGEVIEVLRATAVIEAAREARERQAVSA